MSGASGWNLQPTMLDMSRPAVTPGCLRTQLLARHSCCVTLAGDVWEQGSVRGRVTS